MTPGEHQVKHGGSAVRDQQLWTTDHRQRLFSARRLPLGGALLIYNSTFFQAGRIGRSIRQERIVTVDLTVNKAKSRFVHRREISEYFAGK
jgi:hypothetical protein